MSAKSAAAAQDMEDKRLPDWKLAYRIEEAMAATGLGRTTLYNRARNGKLRMKKDGDNTVILRSDLQQFLNQLPDVKFG